MKYSIDPRRATALAAALLVAGTGLSCGIAQKRMLAEKRSASHVAFARKLMEQGRLRDALTQANMALEEEEGNPDALFARGQIQFGLALYPEAIADFTRAVEERADFTEALSWKAWAEAESGDAASAERDWTKALADPHYRTPEKLHLNLGLLLVREGRREEGMRHLERAVGKNPGYSRGYYELGKLRQESGDLDGATAAFEAALGGMEDSADLNLRLALVLEKRGEGARAREHFRRVIELSPEGPEAELARDHLRRLESAT